MHGSPRDLPNYPAPRILVRTCTIRVLGGCSDATARARQFTSQEERPMDRPDDDFSNDELNNLDQKRDNKAAVSDKRRQRNEQTRQARAVLSQQPPMRPMSDVPSRTPQGEVV